MNYVSAEAITPLAVCLAARNYGLGRYILSVCNL